MAAQRRDELLDLIPAYALDALDDDERVEVEAWLKTDPEAQAILAEYETVAQHLVTLTPLQTAPDHLQADLRQRLAAEARAHGPHQSVRLRRSQWLLTAAALIAIVAVGLLITSLNQNDAAPTPLAAAQLYAQLVAQTGSSQYAVVPGEIDPAVMGDLVISSDGNQAVLRVSALPQVATDQIFQMWLIDESGARTSGGLFQPHATQDTLYIQVPFSQPIASYKGVGVSLEPADGSPYPDQPTGPRVLSVPLS